jgi:hypothetical protein
MLNLAIVLIHIVLIELFNNHKNRKWGHPIRSMHIHGIASFNIHKYHKMGIPNMSEVCVLIQVIRH